MFPYYFLSVANQALVAALTPYVQVFLRNKGYSFSLVGVIVALGQVCSIIFPLLIGSVADKTGKTKLIVFLTTALSVGLLIPVLLSDSLVVTIVCFCLMSAAYYSINPITDGILNAQSIDHPSRYSYMRAAGTMTYVVVLLAFAFFKWPDATRNSSILIGIVVTGLVLALSVLFVPKQGKPEKTQREGKLFEFNWFGKSFYLFLLIVGLSRITHTVVDKLLSSYMTEVLHIGGSFTAYYSISAGSEFVMMIVGGKLLEKKKVTPYGLITVSCLVLVLRMAVLYYFRTPLGLAISQLGHSFTFGALHISSAAFIASHVDKRHQGMAMTMYWAIGTNFPMMIGALAGGYIIDMFGYPALFISYSLFSVIAYILCITCKKTLISEV